jgi:hypothetical protein
MENKKNIKTGQLIETIRLHQQLIAGKGRLERYLTGANRGRYSLRRDLTPFINRIKEAIEIFNNEALESEDWNDLEGFDWPFF